MTIDGKNYWEIDEKKKVKLIDKIEKIIFENGFPEYFVFESMLSEIDSLNENFLSTYRVYEDLETYEFYINGEKMESTWKTEWETITKDYMDHMRTLETTDIDYFIWWFMTDYIGLKYKYICDCCGDAVYSRTIDI